MTAKQLQPLIGQKVLVRFKGLLLTGKLTGFDPRFNQRDALVQLPNEKKPRRFWASKVQEIK